MRRPIALLLAAAGALTLASSARAADGCSNAAFRTGAGADLPECRAWEQVSPVRKNGVGVDYTATMFNAGDRSVFSARGPLGYSEGSPGVTANVATRGSSWTTRGIDPSFDGTFLNLYTTLDVSDDLKTALVTSTQKLAPGGEDGASNVYFHDLVDGGYRLAFSQPGTSLFNAELSTEAGPGHITGSSADLGSFALYAASESLTPDAPAGVINVYQWTASGLRLASVLPGGTPAEGGTTGLDAYRRRDRDQYRMSTDGRRLTMPLSASPLDPAQFAAYQRVDGQRTVLISGSHRTGADRDKPVPIASPGVSPLWASPDGTQVTFADAVTFGAFAPLTNESPSDSYGRIYRWSADGDRLVDLLAGTTTVAATNVQQIVSQSRDGRYVWFLSAVALAPGAEENGFAPNLYVLDTQQRRLTYVAALDSTDVAFTWSPNGTRVAFTTRRAPTGYDNSSPACSTTGDGTPGPCAEAYTFDAAAPSAPVRCASCGATGAAPGGDARIGFVSASVSVTGGYTSRAVTDDGRVFFDTPSRLVSGDANQLADVYERTPDGQLSLITSGTSARPATFVDVAADGRDAFFYTAEPLVGQDDDDLVDAYVARVGGGLASQQAAPAPASCTGDGCRRDVPGAGPRPAPAAPAEARPAAAQFSLLRPSARARRRAAQRGSLAFGVRVSTGGKLALRVRARVKGKTRTVATASRTVKAASTATVTLKLSAAARRKLRRTGRLTLTVTVAFSPVANAKSRVVTLTRPSARKRGGAR